MSLRDLTGFTGAVNSVDDHRRLVWVGEKNFAYKDPTRVRADPLTGRVDWTRMNDRFRDQHSCFAAVSANPEKEQAMVYSAGRQKPNSRSFLHFIEYLISTSWLSHNDIVIMDNSKIHCKGDADIVEDLLWSFELDGSPLHIHVLYLPPRAPALNIIKKCFRIVTQRSQSVCYRISRWGYSPSEMALTSGTKCTCSVMNQIEAAQVAAIARECGYRL